MKTSRLNEIEQFIIMNETVKIDDLCIEFGVSKNTIRRDLDELCVRGNIKKVYGGVSSIKKGKDPISMKTHKNSSSKISIAKLASNLVNDGDTIYIDSGSTAVNIISFMQTKSNITVVTHSLNVMQEASCYKNIKVIGLGGTYNHETGSFIGLSTLEMLNYLNINKAFMSSSSLNINDGFSVNTLLEAEIKKNIISRSKHIYMLCDHTKFDSYATISFCTFDKISALITDQKPSDEYINHCQKIALQLIFHH